jgi:PAS domain S-box-containing protein
MAACMLAGAGLTQPGTLDFGLADFTPRGFCLAWQPGLIWLQAGSDLLTAFACYAIPTAILIILSRRRDLQFRPVLLLFAAFIVACGTTHLFSVATLWMPLYWSEGAVKAVTALLSVITAAVLWPMLPRLLAAPSAAQMQALTTQLESQIAERDLAARHLNDSRRQLRNLYARTPAALHAMDGNGILLEVSDRWLELFRYQRDEVIGRPVRDFFVPELAPAAENLRALATGGGDRLMESRIRRRDGEIRDVEATCELETGSDGGIDRILVALNDVTARKHAEAALRASEDRLHRTRKMEAVGQLTGGIAHDFNNLLTTIMGSMEMLSAHETLQPRGERLTRNALEAAQRAARLTSQMLSFSRRQLLSPESLAPGEIVTGIRDLLHRSAGEQVCLELKAESAAQWHVLADHNELELALVNLVINAREAIENNPARAAGQNRRDTISIGFANHTLGEAEIAAMGQDEIAEQIATGDFVGITVADTGRGMTPDVLARAFEPFFTTKPAGTGLGLSQTYGFATQSGGTVRIQSTQGVGTKVELLLPRGAAAERRAPHDHYATGAEGNGETILLVEDDPLLRQTVADGLRDRGYRVIEAADAPAALAALDHDTTINFLFTDIMMPGGMNGITLARTARRLHAGLKIMFASGYSDRQVVDEWPEPLDLLQKPYGLETLAARISSRLRLKEAAE